jgi:hypothetical protein
MTRSVWVASFLVAAVLVGLAGGDVASAQSPCVDFGGMVDGDN